MGKLSRKLSRQSSTSATSRPPPIEHFELTPAELLTRSQNPEQAAALVAELEAHPMRDDKIDVWVIPTAWRVQWFDAQGEAHGFLYGEDPTGALHSPDDFD